MSSDGSLSSSGSRIRQFGLYRTIDARTEEFLRLSRKRQLQQGCACAAVSTAITVTIVVSVILVYEYSINSESNPDSKLTPRSNWLGLMNDSSDDNLFDAKFTKNMLNLDRTTMKLLPILMKALNQNRYIEKIIEDNSSSSPSYDTRETTEYNMKKYIFPEPTNWFRVHPPKLYSIEYKTSPVVYYRSPKKSSEYFTKIRKIRDYQRIFNYFDRMINEKVGYSFTLPMIIGKYTQSEKPPLKQYAVPIKSHKFQTVARSVVSSRKRTIKQNKDDNKCNCPKKLRELLNKLIGSIKKILPNTSTSFTKCSDGKTSTKSPSKFNLIPILNPKMSRPKLKLSSTTPKLKFITDINSAYSNIGFNNDIATIQKDSLYRTFINMLSSRTRPLDKFDSKQIIFTENQLTLTETKTKTQEKKTAFIVNTYTEATMAEEIIVNPRTHNEYNSFDKVPIDTEKTKSPDFTKRNPAIPILSDDEYDDYFATTSNILNDTLHVHSLQLFKTKMQFFDKDENKIQKNINFLPAPIQRVSNENVSNSRKINLNNNREFNMSNVKETPHKNDTNNSSFYKTTKMSHGVLSSIRINNHSSTPKLKPATLAIFKPLLENRMNPEVTIPKPRLQNKNLTQSNIRYWNDENIKFENSKDQTQDVDNTLLEEDIERGNEGFQDEYRQFYNTVEKPAKNKSEKIKYKLKDNNFNTLVKPSKNYKSDNIKDKFDISKENKGPSMIPSSRPIYLEINRNDWTHDGNQDFDLNINHDLFDLPN